MASPLNVRASDFEDQVHKPLLEKLAAIGATQDCVRGVTADRLSLVVTSGPSERAITGMDKQIALLGDRFPDDQDVQTYSSLSGDIFRHNVKDPDRLDRDLRTLGHRGCWITHEDLYPGQSKTPFAALVLTNRELFVRMNESAAARQITQVDGSVHNSVGLLLSSLVRALGRQKTLRSSDDPMRFSRDTLAAERVIDACASRQWSIAFGTITFDPSNGATGLMSMRTLVQIGQAENELRTLKMARHAISRYRDGLTYVPERLLPAGVVHARDEKGERKRRLDAYMPEFVAGEARAIQQAVRLHAAGASYFDIGDFLAEMDVSARGIANTRYATFGDIGRDRTLSTAARRDRLNWAARKFFRVSTHANLPWRTPGDPAATETDGMFARAYTGKLELWSTGRYLTLRELGVLRGCREIAGVKILYLGDADVGHLPLECNWFVDESGRSTLPMRLDAKSVEASRQRLFDERNRRDRSGGAAHHRVRVRWMPEVPTWTDGLYDYDAPPVDDQGQPIATPVRTYRLRAEATQRDSLMVRVRSRYAHESLRLAGADWAEREGFGTNEGRIEYSMNASELARSVANESLATIGSRLEGLSSPVSLRPRSREVISQVVVEHRIERALRSLARAKARARGARLARDESRGSHQAAVDGGLATDDLEYESAECEEALRAARASVVEAEAALEAAQGAPGSSITDAVPGQDRPTVSAQLGIVAYLIAALRRMAEGDGYTTPDIADLFSQHLIDWRFQKRSEGLVDWLCRLVWDVTETEEASVQLSGSVPNAHLRKGRASGEFSRMAILYVGRGIDEFLDTDRVERGRSGVVSGLNKHLRTSGIPSRNVGPLIDHPIPDVRSYIYRRFVLNQPVPTPQGWTDEFAAYLLEVYTDPIHRLRKGAAVPQRLDAWHALQLGLMHVGGRTTTDAVARAWGLPLSATLNHLRQASPDSFSRLNPFVTTARTVSLLACPHQDCTAALASHLCALPEVVATGHTAICPDCRRVPDPAWKEMVFPEQHATVRWTRTVGVARTTTSPFGPPNPTPTPPPQDNPTTLLNQRQTIEWQGSRLIVPRN